MESELKTLIEGREIFVQRGGAVGRLEDVHGKVCATGALAATWRDHENMDPSEFWHSFDRLNDAAMELYGAPVAAVNDNLGQEAVLHAYDHAIKDALHQYLTED